MFLDFDPLILITTLLSAHTVARGFFLSVILIIITIILGRVFCGWACPLGTLNNMVGSIRRRNLNIVPPSWHRIKYFVLIFLVFSSLFSLQMVGIVDPLSLIIRSFSISIYPLLNLMVRAFFDTVYETDLPGVVTVSETVYSGLKSTFLSFSQPHFRQAVFIGSIFMLILGLNLVEKRFWCRYICPLGALLGVLSRASILKRSVSEGCTECGSCASVCPSKAYPDVIGGWKDSECYYCYNCDDICPENAVSFGFRAEKITAGMDLGRRRVVVSAIAGVATVPLIRSTPALKIGASDPILLRPPGSLEEPKFLERCVKCGECMKVCITNGLQPTFLEAGLEGLWSPILVPLLGYCEYRCTLCGQVCPTGAIEPLTIDKKTRVVIGLAMLDKGRCLPWAHATPCIVCEEVCPTPKKAIWLENKTVEARDGKKIEVKQPHVDLKLCIGCGICENKCPVRGRPAIYVTNIGETRSEENRLLL